MVESEILVKDLSVWFGNNHCLRNITLPIYKNKLTAIIGPSGVANQLCFVVSIE